MQNFYRVGNGINVMPLMATLARAPQLWNADDVRKTFENSPHVDVHDILLRFGDVTKAEEQDFGDMLEAYDYPAMLRLNPHAKQMAVGLMAALGGTRLGRVIITKLEPGHKIAPHADVMGAYSSYYTRYTVMLQCLPGVLYMCGDETVQMETGEAWFVDVSKEHAITNNSKDDRVAMLVDLRFD
jgi:hypothetical protein